MEVSLCSGGWSVHGLPATPKRMLSQNTPRVVARTSVEVRMDRLAVLGTTIKPHLHGIADSAFMRSRTNGIVLRGHRHHCHLGCIQLLANPLRILPWLIPWVTLDGRAKGSLLKRYGLHMPQGGSRRRWPLKKRIGAQVGHLTAIGSALG
jgi:hypothetical protein